jgi:hypothetical protein
VVWDVWNEPDQPYFWDGTREQYLATYEAAYRAIRSVLGARAEISGPSVSRYRWDWLRALVEHCRLTGCEVNVLTWHELPAGRRPIQSITDHLTSVRRRVVGNSSLAAVGVRRLVINEVGGAHDQLMPGELAGYLSALERGGADAAALACWREPCGLDNCATPSLDGLLDPHTLRPRATWWVAKTYADGVAARAWSRSSSTALVSLATRAGRAGGDPEILLGYLDPHDRPAAARLDVRVTVRGLDRVPRLHGTRRLVVRETRLPSAGERPVTQLDRRPAVTVAARGGSAVVTVLGLRLHDAVVLTFSRSPRLTACAPAAR